MKDSKIFEAEKDIPSPEPSSLQYDGENPTRFYPFHVVGQGQVFIDDKGVLHIKNNNGVGFTLSVDPDLTKEDEATLVMSEKGLILKKKQPLNLDGMAHNYLTPQE